MKLKENQSALVLEIDDNGEVEVHVASGDHQGVTASICSAIAQKLMTDGDFQGELMATLDCEDVRA
ncbi:hypothetical protein [Desulfotalea psychrophila]|uniref:hypothetical protein n=1 Tax=Desulfotalea psychrophila TaxID=84980 RepID=UPI0002EF97B3|nr:hypothetical protein [Desulfotalea psychrophila]